MTAPNYWGFRINWRKEAAFNFLKKEILEGRLRQGWGWCEAQKLPHPTLNEGEKGNLPIFQKVRKGDYLLVPHVPSCHFVTIVRAIEDFNDGGYEFHIDPELKDYGHIFHVEYIKKFARGNKNVHANIRSSLRNPMRFWCMSKYGDNIQELLKCKESDLCDSVLSEGLALDNLQEAMRLTIDEDVLREHLYNLFEKSFQASEWEFALRKALELLMPHCSVVRVGGKLEAKHGCDLAVFLPSIEKDKQYVIGIQIKDYRAIVSTDVIKQINKAEYWTDENSNCILIDKYIIVIDSTREENTQLEEVIMSTNDETGNGIRVLYRDDVLDILSRAAKIQMANNLLNI